MRELCVGNRENKNILRESIPTIILLMIYKKIINMKIRYNKLILEFHLAVILLYLQTILIDKWSKVRHGDLCLVICYCDLEMSQFSNTYGYSKQNFCVITVFNDFVAFKLMVIIIIIQYKFIPSIPNTHIKLKSLPTTVSVSNSYFI